MLKFFLLKFSQKLHIYCLLSTNFLKPNGPINYLNKTAKSRSWYNLHFVRWKIRSTNSWKVNCDRETEKINVPLLVFDVSKASIRRQLTQHMYCVNNTSPTYEYNTLSKVSSSVSPCSLVHQIDTFSRLKDFIHSSCSLATDTPPIYCFMLLLLLFSILLLLLACYFALILALTRSIIEPMWNCE